MKRLILISVITTILALTSLANASLVALDRDNAFIYDTDLDITWYNNILTYRTWVGAMQWAASLTVANTVAGSWSLPTTEGTTSVTPPISTSYDGSTPIGYNNTSSKLGHLYYTELNNKAPISSTGQAQSGYGLNYIGPFWLYGSFAGLLKGSYWTSTPQSSLQYIEHNGVQYPQGNVWIFDFSDGFQNYTSLGDPTCYQTALALAYHEGRVGAPVPVPAAAWLFGTGLLSLFGIRKKIRK